MLKKYSLDKPISLLLSFFIVLMAFAAIAAAGNPGAAPGTNSQNVALTPDDLLGDSLEVNYSDTGRINLSLDANGTNAASGTLRVQKPAGATVRKAFLMVATTGFDNHKLTTDEIKLDGTGVNNWDVISPSNIESWNYWKDVTSMVQAKIDAAPAGIVSFTVAESSTQSVDGEILAVVFNDPAQTADNTIVLLFGAQKVNGDTFNIALANPINKSDPNLGLDMSLGISFGFQPTGQYSQVDVNGKRLTTSAGGQDDGANENGALITVGGIGDSNANPPNPFATDLTCGNNPPAPRCDDELYSLLPFVNTSDTKITVFTKNPSNDDNILFAALNLKSVAAVVGEGIVLSPATATNKVNTSHTVTATLQDADGKPVASRQVTFTILSGPNAPKTGNNTTNANGTATFTYTSNGIAGNDTIQASFVDNQQKIIMSNKVEKIWESEGPTPGPTTPVPTTPGPTIPEFPSIIIPATGIMAIVLLLLRKKEE